MYLHSHLSLCSRDSQLGFVFNLNCINITTYYVLITNFFSCAADRGAEFSHTETGHAAYMKIK